MDVLVFLRQHYLGQVHSVKPTEKGIISALLCPARSGTHKHPKIFLLIIYLTVRFSKYVRELTYTVLHYHLGVVPMKESFHEVDGGNPPI